MAAALLEAAAARRKSTIRIASAGTAALVGSPPPPPAIDLMGEEGLDISGHRGRQLTESLARDHELILVAELTHRRWIEAKWPIFRGRVHRLGEGGTADIKDPFGQSREVFAETLSEIKTGVEMWAQRLLQ